METRNSVHGPFTTCLTHGPLQLLPALTRSPPTRNHCTSIMCRVILSILVQEQSISNFHCMRLVRPHFAIPLLRLFVIVHLSSFLVSKSVLDAYYKPVRNPPQQIHRKPAKFAAAPTYQDATDTLAKARTHSTSLCSEQPANPNTMAPRGKTENTKKQSGNVRHPTSALPPLPKTPPLTFFCLIRPKKQKQPPKKPPP